MKVVLFRHAQKGFKPFEDPELTDSGHQQAQRIAMMVEKGLLPKPTHIWVSPKIRTTQTLKPVSMLCSISIQITDSLDLRNQNENANNFRDRVLSFLNSFEENIESKKNETHFLCTHYDWIEESMTLINSDKDLNSFEFSHWSPAQYISLEVQIPTWKFLKKGSTNDIKID